MVGESLQDAEAFRQGLVEPGLGCGHVDLLQFFIGLRGIASARRQSARDTQCSGKRILIGLGKSPMVSVLPRRLCELYHAKYRYLSIKY
ncbi:hypothetical protein D3C81_1994540 [compost metagenome]